MTKKELNEHYRALYPHYRISHLAVSLALNNIPKEVMDEILSGGEQFCIQKDKKERVADRDNSELRAWFRGAMQRMDALLDDDIRHKVREACACCTGGQRHEMARMIRKNNDTLEERVQALNEARHIVGRCAELLDDSRIRVVFGTAAAGGASCPCLRVSDDVMPVTYCYCCGGHIKHHVQTALGVKADCTVVSSLLSSGGQQPCVFEFTITEGKRA